MSEPSWRPTITIAPRPGDPNQDQQPEVVELHQVRTAADRIRYVTDPENWCRQNLDHELERWCRKTVVGLDRSGYLPVFSFSDQDTAFAFKLKWY